MKKFVVSILFASIVFSCNERKEIPSTQGLSDKFNTKSEIYSRVIRDNFRLEAVQAKIKFDKSQSKSHLQTINDLTSRVIDDLQASQGDGFKEKASLVMNSDQIKNLIIASSNSRNARKSPDESVKAIFKSQPAYLQKVILDYRENITEKVQEYTSKVDAKKASYKSEELQMAIKGATSEYEEQVIKDKTLTEEQKKEIFQFTSFNFANAETIASNSIGAYGSILKNGRVSGFFSALWNIVVSIVVAVVLGAIVGATAGAGDPVAALVGAIVGLGLGIMNVIQNDCICFSYIGPGQYSFTECPCI